MINILLFLPIHCRKTILSHSTRDTLREKYTEKKKKKKPNVLRLKSAVPGMENQDFFTSEFIGPEGWGLKFAQSLCKGT